MTIWNILRNALINSNFHARVNMTVKSKWLKSSHIFWPALGISQVSHCWDKMPDIHILKEETVYLSRDLSPYLPGSKVGTPMVEGHGGAKPWCSGIRAQGESVSEEIPSKGMPRVILPIGPHLLITHLAMSNSGVSHWWAQYLPDPITALGLSWSC